MSDVIHARPAHPAFPALRLAAPSAWPTRRGLQVALGLVWLLDAGLQFQPFMFGRGFATQILEPAAAGQPGPVAGPLLWSAHLVAAHPVAANAAFAVIQLAIAAGLLIRRTVRPALAVSIAWALGVWWLGEGLGGTLTGASPLAGAPGAVILYALIALLVWPRSPLGSGVPGPVARGAWAVLWCWFAACLLLPANRAPGAVSQVFAAAGSGQPGWIRSLDQALARLTAGHGLAVSLLLAALCLAVGAGVAAGVRWTTRPALVVAGLLGLLFWVAQAFGGLATGQATDPNSGPLLILLAACFWPPSAGRAGAGRAPAGRAGVRSAVVSGCRGARADSSRRRGPGVLPGRRARHGRRREGRAARMDGRGGGRLRRVRGPAGRHSALLGRARH